MKFADMMMNGNDPRWIATLVDKKGGMRITKRQFVSADAHENYVCIYSEFADLQIISCAVWSPECGRN
jgi:hypothetical protein